MWPSSGREVGDADVGTGYILGGGEHDLTESKVKGDSCAPSVEWGRDVHP